MFGMGRVDLGLPTLARKIPGDLGQAIIGRRDYQFQVEGALEFW